MKRALVLLAGVVLLAMTAGCNLDTAFRRNVQVSMVPVYEGFVGYGANAMPIKFYVTANGDPVAGQNVTYRVLPPEVGEVKSLTEMTDANGMDMTMFYVTQPVLEPGREVKIEVTVGRHVREFDLAILPYDRTAGGDLTFFSDAGKNNVEEAEARVRGARLKLDLRQYYSCLVDLQVAEACLDYADTITDRELEARLRRDIARYRELVRAAAFPKDDNPNPPQRVVLEGLAFETGKWEILPQYAAVVRAAGTVLQQHPEAKVVINGHTDNVPIPMGNQLLSVRRAQAVRDFLVREMGIAADRLSVRGFGQERPIAENTTAEGRARNRRVEFEIIGPPTALLF